jgi:hypothetical protein
MTGSYSASSFITESDGQGGTLVVDPNSASVTNPTLSNVAASVADSIGGQTVTVSPALSVSDPDNLTLVNATVSVSGGFARDGDVLGFNTAGTGITASYNSSTEMLTLTGTDTLAHYQSVLDSVTFTSGADRTNSGANPTRTVSWVINDGSASNKQSAPATTTIRLTGPARNDLNGDGKSDLLAQSTGGSVMIELLNGTTVSNSFTIANPGSATVVATGDFNGDGKADIVVQTPDGTPEIWLMNGPTVASTVVLPTPPSSWHIIATGDFNGDGMTDILWQNTNGQPAIWEMNGTSIMSAVGLAAPPSSWRVIGTGDFNGDGKSDILWQNTNGTPAIWEMNGTTVIGAADLPAPPPSWHIVGTGDFNGDGKSDILWINDNNTPAIWEMNGTSIINAVALPAPPPSWKLIGTGDFNGDGKSDILWQNQDGTPAIWEMNGTSIASAFALPSPGVGWQLNDDGPIPGDQMGTAAAGTSPQGNSVHLSAPDAAAGSAPPRPLAMQAGPSGASSSPGIVGPAVDAGLGALTLSDPAQLASGLETGRTTHALVGS